MREVKENWHRLSEGGSSRQSEPGFRQWDGLRRLSDSGRKRSDAGRRLSEGYGGPLIGQDSGFNSDYSVSDTGSPRTMCSQQSISSDVMQICMPASESKRDAHALGLAASFFDDQDFQEKCKAALKTNIGIMEAQAQEDEVRRMKECLRRAMDNGYQVFQMLRTHNRHSERRSQHAASELQKALKALESTAVLLETSNNKQTSSEATLKESSEQLQSVMAENAELKCLLEDYMRANNSQNRVQLPQPDDPLPESPANSVTRGHPGPHFCVKSWLTFFSEV